ncbi:ethanolamine utilization protein EutN [Melghirimyces profundicolus]|uniref:Ethanolamine utilization protein EutN n=1 Tax=Melghirimyces profundicolus TaxID=1242148 RepID=A0A2T6C8K6_9BACL|nr:EutN/CcmL family microcompartment protein [Melghirimyces profundicolus]PTX64640.1 ethanolamine utilization protein EutN [Melghirimyces profundicolus]
MRIGTVIGKVWATRKEGKFQGLKFLVIQPEDASGEPAGEVIVAVDQIGAGDRDKVIVTEGSSARFILSNTETAVDAAVVGIIDSVDLEGGKQS